MAPTDQNSPLQGQISEIVDRLNQANNVLITVSNDPSVDQLAACIGLTLALNKKNKHATAVFSGNVPSVIDFLEPDKTIEKDTNSLRDFIISLDKSKADKLRYKVEDSVVKIFITPYKTSISEADLDFGQGDFNVDAVVALGVHNRSELDAAIVAHGRILHDATIISLNSTGGAELGSLNWIDSTTSSLCQMTSDLVQALDSGVLDAQIATAFLTGIVAETDRFKNEKASPHTMSVAGILMAAGASPKLVSSKLEEPIVDHVSDEIPEALDTETETPTPNVNDGVIEIDHEDDKIHIDDSGKFAQVSDILREIDEKAQEEKRIESSASAVEESHDPSIPSHLKGRSDKPRVTRGSDLDSQLITPPIVDTTQEEATASDVSNQGLDSLEEARTGANNASNVSSEPDLVQPQLSGPSMIYQPPTFGGQLTANTSQVDQHYISSPDPLTVDPGSSGPMLNHMSSISSPPASDSSTQTLTDLEKSVNSPHVLDYEETPDNKTIFGPTAPDVPPADPDYARDAVQRAAQGSADYRPEPTQALGSQRFGLDIHPPEPPPQEDNAYQGPPPPPVPPPLSTSP